jgi:hypothetical protein
VDRQRETERVELRALIFRPEQGYLFIRPTDEADGPWDLPGGPHESHTAPEIVLRQLCAAQIGCDVQVLAGRPPMRFGQGASSISYRLYLCALPADEALPLGCAAVRWVPAAALGEFRLSPGIARIMAHVR